MKLLLIEVNIYNSKMCQMRYIFFLVAISLTSFSVSAQDRYISSEYNELIIQLNMVKKIQPSSPDIMGSPYLVDDFQKGDIYYDGKFKFSQVLLRYNLYNDEMEFKKKNTSRIKWSKQIRQYYIFTRMQCRIFYTTHRKPI